MGIVHSFLASATTPYPSRCTTFARKTKKGMKIKLNESENSIEIKDGLNNQYLILKILMILNLANAVIRIYGKQTTEYGFIEYIWVGLGIISLVVLFMFLFKMSTAENTVSYTHLTLPTSDLV